jgi:hypothetical protein
MKEAIMKYGYTKRRFGRDWYYVEIKGFKYWFDKKVLNREWLNGYELDMRRKIFKRKGGDVNGNQ